MRPDRLTSINLRGVDCATAAQAGASSAMEYQLGLGRLFEIKHVSNASSLKMLSGSTDGSSTKSPQRRTRLFSLSAGVVKGCDASAHVCEMLVVGVLDSRLTDTG